MSPRTENTIGLLDAVSNRFRECFCLERENDVRGFRADSSSLPTKMSEDVRFGYVDPRIERFDVRFEVRADRV